MTEPIISIDNVHKSYLMGKEAVPALRGVSLGIEQGDFVCLMGPSGSGKTTLLNVIGGLDEPSRGHVTVDGENGSFVGARAGQTSLEPGKLHFCRVREQGAGGRWSEWSSWHQGFQTAGK